MSSFITKTIDPLDKQSLRDYVELINKDQEEVNIGLSFKISQADDNEYCAFIINGKLNIKHSLDEAISFLDGILLTLDLTINKR